MRVLIPIKRVIDANVRVRVRADGSGVELSNVKMAMNPFCEVAVEQAIRMREAGAASDVIVVSVGDAACHDVIRTAYAMGADKGVLVQSEHDLEPLAVAKTLKAVAEREGAELIICGKQAIDGDNNQTGQMLSALLGWPQGTFVSRIEVVDGGISVTREVDGGLEELRLALPAVVTVDLRLNEPRYATLPAIMKAKRMPFETVTPEELGVDAEPRLLTLKVEEAPGRDAGVILASASELVERLRDEAKVL